MKKSTKCNVVVQRVQCHITAHNNVKAKLDAQNFIFIAIPFPIALHIPYKVQNVISNHT